MNGGSTRPPSESGHDLGPGKKPRGSRDPLVQPLAPMGPRLSSRSTFDRLQPRVGTTPVANLISAPPTWPLTQAGPRASPFVRSPTASSKPSFSNSGVAYGLVRRTMSGSSSAGESPAGRDLSTAR